MTYTFFNAYILRYTKSYVVIAKPYSFCKTSMEALASSLFDSLTFEDTENSKKLHEKKRWPGNNKNMQLLQKMKFSQSEICYALQCF